MADDTLDKLSEIDSLTGVPITEDILLFGLPMCGPYSAIQNYKYKVKLTPGHLKRGKAVQTILAVFNKMPEAIQKEKDLLKNINEADLNNTIISNSKINMPGLFKNTNAIAKAAKKAKQKQAKQTDE
eukprot:TRINITY_DN2072_c0_g1_i3.p2 TRINITY_DN2072_c0_g1~~TRINITY_DN2072_c0_g1_i3.p2  ORF type:complete len:127 (-),score=44.60 TRINITY_DN2072_c0_g1_i3:133-513(-)